MEHYTLLSYDILQYYNALTPCYIALSHKEVQASKYYSALTHKDLILLSAVMLYVTFTLQKYHNLRH